MRLRFKPKRDLSLYVFASFKRNLLLEICEPLQAFTLFPPLGI